MSLLEASVGYKPFRYPWAFDFWKRQQQVHWMPEEVPLGEDCRDWAIKLNDQERNLLTQIFRFFTQADIEVQDCYHSKYGLVFKPTEIKMMLTVFSAMETTHVAAYSHLLDTIGMPESEYSAFMQYKEMKDKHDYMSQFGVDNDADIARTLAMFGGFTEGVQLFASFAMLMNFPRFNKMKGMGQIISWSIRDECLSDDTEVLTPNGWVKFPDLKDGDSVMQFDPLTDQLSFVVPDRIVRKPYNGNLIAHKKRQFDIRCTPNHDIIHKDESGWIKTKAGEFKPHQRRKVPVSGIYVGGSNSQLTALERLKIAYAADGAKISSENRTGEKVGYQRVTFDLFKTRKINRLYQLSNEAGIRINELKPNLFKRKFSIDLPAGHAQKTMADWVDLSTMTIKRARDFIDEVLNWDAHVSLLGRSIFCSTNKRDIDLLQAIAVIAGYSTTLSVSEDNRKESYKTYYRLSFWANTTTPTKGNEAPSLIPYNGIVYCVSVPGGCFVIRRNGAVHITGNSLHCEGITKLFKVFCEERNCLTKSVKDDIYDCCQTTVKLEDNFIDLAFQMGAIEGMIPQDIKNYIRYIADWRLNQLGLNPIYNIENHPIPWLIPLINGVEHTNFFEQRATAYSKAATKGNWNDVWDNYDKRNKNLSIVN